MKSTEKTTIILWALASFFEALAIIFNLVSDGFTKSVIINIFLLVLFLFNLVLNIINQKKGKEKNEPSQKSLSEAE